ncbi:MAG: hypothetical protein HY097_05715, partial [Nitrospinae bacterium]|nr:hypothetical protein [Nitrospinota bacterium]
KSMIERYRRADIRIVNLFMHSFSFIEEASYLKGRQFINRYDLKKFEEIVAYLRTLDWIKFITMREIAVRYQDDRNFMEYILGGSNKIQVSFFGVDLLTVLKKMYV